MTGIKQTYGKMYQGRGYENNPLNNKFRVDIICEHCRVHTLQAKTEKGWKCTECNKIMKGVTNG